MPDGGTVVGGIAKLTIEAFADAACTRPSGDPKIVVPINPKSYSQTLGVKYTEDEAMGGNGQARVLHRERGESLELDLILDGTGAVPGATRAAVVEQVLALRRIGLKLNPPRPPKEGPGEANYLKLSWGSLLFKCRMTSLVIKYTLFNPDGTPLRAEVKAKFDDAPAPAGVGKTAVGKTDNKGAMITLGDGDTLAGLCDKIYGDNAYALDVAGANGLDGFRSLAAGTTLYFPPLAGAKA